MEEKNKKLSLGLDNFVKIALFSILGITALAFVPNYFSYLDITPFLKGSFFVVSTLIVFVVFLFSKLISGKVEKIEKNIFFALLSIFGAVALSTVFSVNLRDSLFSDTFKVESASFMISALLFCFMLASLSNKSKFQDRFVFFGAVIVLAIQLLHVVGIFTSGIPFLFSYSTQTIFGSWTDLSIVSSALALVMFIALDYSGLSKKSRYIVLSAGVFSLLFSLLSKEKAVILAFGVASLFFFLVRSIDISKKGQKNIPFVSLSLVVFSAIALISSSFISGFVTNRLGFSENFIRPSFGSSVHVIKGEFGENLLFGSGPGRYDIAWQKNRPEAVVTDMNFWNTNFDSGSSFVTTFVAQNGLVGLLAIVLFYFFVIRACFKNIKETYSESSKEKSYRTWQVLSIVVFSLVIFLTYTPGIVATLFLFSFISVFASKDKSEENSVSFLSDPRIVFISLVIGVVLIVSSIIFTYSSVARVLAFSYETKARLSDVSETQIGYVLKAEALSPTDRTYILKSQILGNILAKTISNQNISEEIKNTSVSSTYTSLEESVVRSLNYDSQNSANWIYAGDLYTSLIPLSVENAEQNAMYSFDQASSVDKNNPAIDIYRANIYINKKNYSTAKEMIRLAISKKPNFVDAYVYLIKIEKIQGNKETALSIAKEMVLNIPNSADSYVQLGDVLFETNDIKGALSAYQQSMSLGKVNAPYLLEIGKFFALYDDKDVAKNIYEFLVNYFPESSDVQSLGNLIGDSPVALPETIDTNTNTDPQDKSE